jgi:serine/threonine-protein kinase
LKLAPGPYQFPRVSPDGRRVAVGTDDGKDANISVYDLSGATSIQQLTFAGKNRYPVWSADGARVAFQSDREGDLGIFWQRADGTGTGERLTKPEQGTSHVPQSWSRDGQTFLYEVMKGSTRSLWTLSAEDKKAALFVEVQSPFPLAGVFSPDGRWVAYQASDGPTAPMFVEPFPRSGAKYVLPAPGGQPLWSPDGKELVFQQLDEMFGVSVTTQPSFTFGNPVLVLKRQGWRNAGPSLEREYDVMPDGKRFIGVADAAPSQPGAPVAPQIQVVLNWFTELRQRVPTK